MTSLRKWSAVFGLLTSGFILPAHADVRDAAVVDGLVVASFKHVDESPWNGEWQFIATRCAEGPAMRLDSMAGSGYPAGRRVWGCIGTHLFNVVPDFGRPPIASPIVSRANARDVVALLGGESLVGVEKKDAAHRWGEVDRQHNVALGHVSAEVYKGWGSGELPRDWNLFYDFHFVDQFDGHLFVVRDNVLQWSTVNVEAPEFHRREWSDATAVPTNIDGEFRVMRSGDRLVLIDEDGRVFSSPREGHALIGQIADWPTDEETDRDVYLLEDASTHELRIVEVVEEKGDGNGDGGKRFVRSLAFDEDKDNPHGNPFTADLPREEIQQALIRLTEAIEDGNRGGGDGG